MKSRCGLLLVLIWEGKSTYLRQVAQICILAQIGSFVPAKQVNLPLLDRFFTRIGSGDNLAEGKSTFLIEMEETASICTQATKNSLVILDEVGRGTSTFDGLAIAQAVVEYLYETIQARCLFATHYHELTHLQKRYAGIVSYYASSKKAGDTIIFLYTMIRGVADGSFGVQVAKLAQLPPSIVLRAQELVEQFDLFLNTHYVASFLVSVLVTQGWRSVSEIFRADHRGESRISVYQIMGIVAIIYSFILWKWFPDSNPMAYALEGIQTLWQPEIIIFLLLLWLGIFLHTGCSKVTGSIVSFHVHEDKRLDAGFPF